MPSQAELRYESLKQPHLQQVAVLHEVCFPGYYLTRLGPAFLQAMYGWYVESPHAIGRVALDAEERVVGFVAGTTDADTYHRALFRERGGAMLAALVRRVVRSPVATFRLVWERKDLAGQAITSVLSRSSSAPGQADVAPKEEAPMASLVSIGIEPSMRRLGIGRRLSEIFLQEARARGCRAVALSVREDNEAARRFYQSLGWAEASKSSQAYHGSVSITYQRTTRG